MFYDMFFFGPFHSSCEDPSFSERVGSWLSPLGLWVACTSPWTPRSVMDVVEIHGANWPGRSLTWHVNLSLHIWYVFNVLFDWSNVHIIYSGFSSFTWTFKPPPTSPLYQSLASSNSLSLRGNRGWGVWKLQAVPLVQLSMCVSMVCCCLWHVCSLFASYSVC